MTKKILSILTGTIILVSSSTLAAPLVKLEPSQVVQGKHFKLEYLYDDSERNPYETQKETISPKVRFNNKIIPLTTKGGNLYETYIAIAADHKPGSHKLEILGNNNEVLDTKTIQVIKGKFAAQYIKFYRPNLTKAQEEQIKKEDALVDNARMAYSPQQLWQGKFILPVSHRVNGNYGIYRYLNGNYNGYHGGVDFASPQGTPIKAINNARVTLARYFSKYNSNGNIVFLDHGAGITSAYIHLSKIAVKEGQMVKKGDVIGYVGSTGRSTGPHLHWGFYLNGQNTDGLNWVRYSQIFE